MNSQSGEAGTGFLALRRLPQAPLPILSIEKSYAGMCVCVSVLCKGESPPPAHAVLSSAHYSPVEGEDSTDHLGSSTYVPGSWESQATPSAFLRHGSPHGPSQRTAVATPGLAALAGLSGQGEVWPPTAPVRRAGLEVRACRKPSRKEPARCTDSVKGLPWSQNEKGQAPQP